MCMRDLYFYMYITERYYMVHTQHLHVYMYIAEESQCSSFWYHVNKKTTLYMHIYIYIIRTSPAHHFPFPTTSSAPTEAALAGNLVSLKKVDDLHTGHKVESQVASQTPWGFNRKDLGGKLKATAWQSSSLLVHQCFDLHYRKLYLNDLRYINSSL